ncbi:MAG: LLM class flavin-dependent oxidoreductase [Gammaproteobacteria bacterium]|nr:LLM class flavin-dependent oxidoreductase [Gammaproteobacteria bacterium]
MTSATKRPGPRFGIWAVVYGTSASLHHPEDPPDASWARNRDLVLEAEALGIDSVLVAQHIVNPFGDEFDQLETLTSCGALAALTDNIEIIAAIKPYLFHPAVFAKMALQLEEISEGRFSLNFVNAWFRPEFEKAGIPFPPHDERYVYGGEWLRVVKRLISGEQVTVDGDNFKLDGYQFKPASKWRPRPLLYSGGESEAALNLTVELCDTWFMFGQPLEDVAGKIAAMRKRPRSGTPLSYGVSAFPFARPTQSEAEEALAYAFELREKDREVYEALHRNADPEVVTSKVIAKVPGIGVGNGTGCGFTGSYDEVARRIAAFHDAGIEIMLLEFQPFEREMRRFAEEVMPRVARLCSSK